MASSFMMPASCIRFIARCVSGRHPLRRTATAEAPPSPFGNCEGPDPSEAILFDAVGYRLIRAFNAIETGGHLEMAAIVFNKQPHDLT